MKTILKEIDPISFENSLKITPRSRKFKLRQDPVERKRIEEKWSVLNSRLKKKIKNYNEPDTPFNEKNLVRSFNSLYYKISDKEKYVNL